MFSRENYKLTFKELVLLLLGRRLHFKVEGESMLPFLRPGDHVLIKKGYSSLGSIIVAKDKHMLVIKKLHSINDQKVKLTSINPEGRSLELKQDQILGELSAIF